MSHHLSYWKPKTLEDHASHPILVHSASPQYKRLEIGDVIWIVSSRKTTHLELFARIRVDHIVGQERAEEILQQDLWYSDYHVLTDKPEKTKRLDISKLALKLRFEGVNDRLPEDFSGRHFQSMRKLRATSIDLIENLWRNTKMSKQTDIGKGQKECPKCGKVVGARSSKCKHCGAVLKAKKAVNKPKKFSITVKQIRVVAEIIWRNDSIGVNADDLMLLRQDDIDLNEEITSDMTAGEIKAITKKKERREWLMEQWDDGVKSVLGDVSRKDLDRIMTIASDYYSFNDIG